MRTEIRSWRRKIDGWHGPNTRDLRLKFPRPDLHLEKALSPFSPLAASSHSVFFLSWHTLKYRKPPFSPRTHLDANKTKLITVFSFSISITKWKYFKFHVWYTILGYTTVTVIRPGFAGITCYAPNLRVLQHHMYFLIILIVKNMPHEHREIISLHICKQ